jgi:hypothetical protein
VEAPSERDFIICGCPRSGTSLLSAVLHQPPESVVVMEPWDGMRLPPAELFASLRAEMGETGRLTRGKLSFDALSKDGEVRWRREDAVAQEVEVDEGHLLGVKWPAFWRYLEMLPTTRFLVCLRDPAEVIASFKRVGGRLGQGLEYDTAFNRGMNDVLLKTQDVALRRVRFFDHVHSRILPFLSRPNVLAVRYERWFKEPERLLGEIGHFLGADVTRAPAVIQQREHRTPLGPDEMALLQKECRTAEAIGYPLTAHRMASS